MKRRLMAAFAALALALTGCASLLDREYVHVTPHNTTPTAEGDPSILRAENYQELVNALIYFVTQGVEGGSIRLYSDWDDAEADLEAACLEVVQEDPLGAYAVEFIKYSVNSVVTYYEADVQITYRRTRDQVASIVSATGTTAIRSELESTLAFFSPECVLRISYFDGDEDYIRTLFREAYYANPVAALDFPGAAIAIYPESGRQRIVEILLTYHLDTQELVRRRDLLDLECQTAVRPLLTLRDDQQLLEAARTVLNSGAYLPSGGNTAYHALVEGGANSEGLSLAMALLCQALNRPCQIVEGTWNGEPHFWTVVNTQAGWMHLDLSRFDELETPFCSDAQLEADGYAWDTQGVPQCGQLIPDEP